jgi:hypothetical protein
MKMTICQDCGASPDDEQGHEDFCGRSQTITPDMFMEYREDGRFFKPLCPNCDEVGEHECDVSWQEGDDTAEILPIETYVWPGGYPTYAVTDDAAVLCPRCANENGHEDKTVHDGWQIVGVDVNWEDPALFCDHCSERIESAYAEDEVGQ